MEETVLVRPSAVADVNDKCLRSTHSSRLLSNFHYFHCFRADFLANFSEFPVLNTARACHFRDSQTACMVRIEVTTLVLVGLVVALRLCSRDPPSRKLCGPGAVAIRLPGLSPTVRDRSFCYYSDVVT